MKRILFVVIAMLLVACQSPVSAPTEITIRGEVYSTDLTELWLLDLSLTDSDIEPLRYMTNLEFLALGYNEISDLSPLSNLVSLEILSLSTNPINDISTLSELINLTDLNLENTQVSDINALGGLTSLTILHLAGSPALDDISVLFGLSNLEHVDFGVGQISEVQEQELQAARPNLWITIGF